MFNEYDVVVSTEDLSEKIPKGCIGTVLMCYEKRSEEYEVEFIDGDGMTVDVLTIKSSKISLLDS